jgi:Glucose-6-phosphate dehydrogenase subunit
MAIVTPLRVGMPVLRWSARAHSIAEIEHELARIWATQDLTTAVDGQPGRYVAARSSVMNLVVVGRRPEVAVHCAATIQALTGRHPSRTMIVGSADPDGPSWLDARIEAHCILPREGSPETCAEMIHVTVGGEAGRHLAAIVNPLLIHDLPVTVWWPDEPPLGLPATRDLLASADRLVVDGSTWNGDGLDRLRELHGLAVSSRLAVSDFALMRQSRWREAIASIFDDPEFLPYLHSLRRIAVTYGTHDATGSFGYTNLVKPVYHVAWLASRLGLHVAKPLAAIAGPTKPPPSRVVRSTGVIQAAGRGLSAVLSDGHREVSVLVRPVLSPMPAGTTLRVELLAERRGSELRADVTAEAETVHVRVWQDGVEALERQFRAPRLTEVDLLLEAIEGGRRDPVGAGALHSAANLAGPAGSRG